MKTITINLYKFNELSEKAKQTAINDYRNEQDNYIYYDEIIETVKKLIDLFNLKTGNRYTDIRCSHIDDTILELSGVRLYKYIMNNYGKELFTPKFKKCIDREVKSKSYICKVDTNWKGEKYTMLYYKHKTDNSCVLTGVCYDDDILKPVYDFLSKPDKNTTFEDLISEIESAIKKTFDNTEQWLNSDEFITEEIENNGYDFTENGKVA
jgi:hypothetical protein